MIQKWRLWWWMVIGDWITKNWRLLTLFVLSLIYPFPVDSVAVDFAAVDFAAVRPTRSYTERYVSLVVNVKGRPFDNLPTQWYPVLSLPSAPSISNVNRKMTSLPKCRPRIKLTKIISVPITSVNSVSSHHNNLRTSRAVCRILHVLHCLAA